MQMDCEWLSDTNLQAASELLSPVTCTLERTWFFGFCRGTKPEWDCNATGETLKVLLNVEGQSREQKSGLSLKKVFKFYLILSSKAIEQQLQMLPIWCKACC